MLLKWKCVKDSHYKQNFSKTCPLWMLKKWLIDWLVINANLKNVFAIQIRKRNRTQVEVKQRINGWNLERDKNYEKLILMALLPMCRRDNILTLPTSVQIHLKIQYKQHWLTHVLSGKRKLDFWTSLPHKHQTIKGVLCPTINWLMLTLPFLVPRNHRLPINTLRIIHGRLVPFKLTAGN